MEKLKENDKFGTYYESLQDISMTALNLYEPQKH